jgi:putative peptidoglycan lipid II flippase
VSVEPVDGADPSGQDGPTGGWQAAAVAGVAGSAMVIAGITIAARVTGLGRTLVFSGAVGGGGCVGTAYATANLLPTVLFEVAAGGALAGAVVPVLAGLLARGRDREAEEVASALLGWVLVTLTPLAVLLVLLSRPLTALLLDPGPDCPGQRELGVRMLVVFAPQVVLYGIGIVLTGVLQARRRFAWPAAMPLLSSLVVIASYVVYASLADGHQRDVGWVPDRGAELVLSVGTTLGVVALSLPLLWPVLRGGVRLRPRLRFPAGTAREVTALAAAGLSALLAQQGAVIATVILANRVGGQGAINVIQFAQAVYLLPYAVLAVPLATAAFPRLSAQASREDSAAFAGTAAVTARWVLLVSGAGAAVLAGTAEAVQALFLGIDAVGGGPFRSMAAVLLGFAPGLVGWSLVAHLSRVLYATGRGRAAAGAAAAGWGTAVLASVVVVIGGVTAGGDPASVTVIGLAAGNSVGMATAAVLLLVAVRRYRGGAAVAGIRGALLRVGAAVVPATAVGWMVVSLLLDGQGTTGGVLRPVLVGSAAAVLSTLVYVLTLRLIDRRDLDALVASLRHRDGLTNTNTNTDTDTDRIEAGAPETSREPEGR